MNGKINGNELIELNPVSLMPFLIADLQCLLYLLKNALVELPYMKTRFPFQTFEQFRFAGVFCDSL